MKFRCLPIEQALGHLLGHNISDANGRRLRKGRSLTSDDVELLLRLGRPSVYVAELEADDLLEDVCAARIAAALEAPGMRLTKARTGRVNLFAEEIGVLRPLESGLLAINSLDGVTLATLPHQATVAQGKMLATLKIIPYALPQARVLEALTIIEREPILRLDLLCSLRVSLVLSGSAQAEERIAPAFRSALASRIEQLGSEIVRTDFVPLVPGCEKEHLSSAIQLQLDAGSELVLLAGETAIMDVHDIAPLAIEALGGVIETHGAPVDPGNLLLLAYVGDIPIVGAPGCARSPKTNIVDLILPRLLAGERLRARDIHQLGLGGLLEDVPERPLPRSWLT